MSISKIRTSDGAEHGIDYEGLENKPATQAGFSTFSGIDINSDETIEIDASAHLPNDGCNYLLSVQVCNGTSSGSGFIGLWGHTDLMPTKGSYAFVRITLPQYGCGQCEVLIGPERKLYIWNSGSSIAKNTIIKLLHYKKA